MENKKIINKLLFEEILEKNNYVDAFRIIADSHSRETLKAFIDEYFFFILKNFTDYYSDITVSMKYGSYYADLFELFISNINNENNKQIALLIQTLFTSISYLYEIKADNQTTEALMSRVDEIYHEMIGIKSHQSLMESKLDHLELQVRE
jgi:hypothetical protein